MVQLSFTEGFASIINGQKISAPTAQAIVNPATEHVFTHVPFATHQQLQDAIDAAELAFPSWSAKPWEDRQRVLEHIADMIEEHAAHFIALLIQEVGKDQSAARLEISLAPKYLREFAKYRLDDEIVHEDAHKLAISRFRPYGVCGAIIPFNVPLVLTIIKTAQAILAGNCIIVKSPPTAPCTIARFVEACQAFLPPGVLSVLCGGNDLGEQIVKHPKITRISMTGSTTAGKAIMRGAADELKSVTLELGGNDACIVLDDVDPQQVASHILWGSTSNKGESCFQMKRIYVHEKVYDAVRDALVALAKDVKVGNPFLPDVTMGPVQNKAQHARLRDLLAECKERGYAIAFESEIPSGRGYYIPLTIVDNPPEDARIVREEQFGPIVPLMKWSEDAEVVRRANDSEYGLSASIWGHDFARMQRMGDQLVVGMVWYNDWGAVSGDSPMGGAKHSGVGVESSKHGLASWTYVQSVVRNKSFGRARTT